MSILEKQWIIQKSAPKKFFDTCSEYSNVTQQLLYSRGIRTKKGMQNFFYSDYDKDLHSPYLLKNILLAVKRLSKAIDSGEKILIYGDYDADGVCASIILKQVFNELGASNVEVYIPHREDEGYGLNNGAIDGFIKKDIGVIITVDCGSTNIEEVEYAKKNNIDVVVTDHHQVLHDKHPAYALVNPHQKGDKYPFKGLSGAAVAFKFSQALLDHRRKNKKKAPELGWEKWMLDLVAISTVTDVMPLLGENRTLVKYGLFVLAQTKRHGLRELMKVAKLSPIINRKNRTTNLKAFALGFVLGPRLNAAGRMDHANLALNLLDAQSQIVAKDLSIKLDKKNKERQALVQKILKEVNGSLDSADTCIFEGREHWPIGVLGIVAGRLSDRFQKPSFIYQKKKDKLVGSARTPRGFNTVSLLKECSPHLLKFGGHKQAGGFTALVKNESKLSRGLKTASKKNSFIADAHIEVDSKINFEDINWGFYGELEAFEPHGEGNLKPIFCLKNIFLSGIRNVGKDSSHFKCDILGEENGARLSAIGFALADKASQLKDGDVVDILFNLEADEWNGNKKLTLNIIDIKNKKLS